MIEVNGKPMHRVIVEFPTDVSRLVKVLDWLYNSGNFAQLYMTDELIKDLSKITNVVEVEDDEDQGI